MRLDKFEFRFFKNGKLIENEFTKRVVEFKTDLDHDLQYLSVSMFDPDPVKTANIYMKMVEALNKNENNPIFDTVIIHSIGPLDKCLMTFKFNIVDSFNMDIPHFDLNKYGRLFKPKLLLSFDNCEIKLHEYED